MTSIRRLLLILAVGFVLGGCKTQGRDAYAITSTDTLITFDTENASSISNEATITGLDAGETLLQIDIRPSNKTLYGITSNNYLVTVDPATGVATRVGTTQFTQSTEPLTAPLMDFNPASDYLRVISYQSGATNNAIIRVNPDTGAFIQTDGSTLSYIVGDINEGEAPQLVALAYSNNLSDATTTTLYGLDFTVGSLVRVTTTGSLTTIAALDTGFTTGAGFDIVPNDDKAYVAIADSGGSARIFRLDLSDGSTSSASTIGDGVQIRSLAVTLDEPKQTGFGN